VRSAARLRTVVALAAAVSAGACAEPEQAAPRAGGDTTVDDRTTEAYSMPAPNLDAEAFERHRAGDAAFEAVFVAAPADVNPGLGPMFNNTACARCHLRDGRGMPVAGPGPLRSHLLVRVSMADGGDVPAVGRQLQDQAVFGVEPEAVVDLAWVDVPGTYGDGAPFTLRRPSLAITLAGGAPLPADVQTSLRQPPPVFGLGLLEAIPEDEIVAAADPDDADGDGISGRVNRVADGALGRFGHKANTATLVLQAAAAYANDMGVTADEIDPAIVEDTAFYTQTLGVPARTGLDDADVQRGEDLFASHGCASCHTPTQGSGDHPVAAVAHQTFHPYTDLLLHDLGEDLADGRPDFDADGREWRTPPLWGIGLTHTVLAGSAFLHDGRARTLEEAVLWHGGEAEASREAFRTSSAADRAALIAFLRSL
jgi:CxxC motif-containing protein (DUF1111 family)